MPFWLKILISAVIVATVSEIAKRNPVFAALVASLPLVSVLGMVWIWQDTRDAERLASHTEATFWYVLPSLPMFLVIPALLRAGIGFWIALVIGIAITALLYIFTTAILARFGVNL